jgi:cytidylate kinase
MKCNADRLIQGLVTAQLKEQQAAHNRKAQQVWKKSETFVVTISRNFGSLGKKAGKLLAEALGVRCCDRYILQEVARRADIDEDLVRLLDEHVSRIDKHWWEALIHKNTFSHEDYYKYLVKTVFSISLRGGVIIGRGANLILGPERAFRVRIIGSPRKCAERVAERDNISQEKALQLVHDVDQERAEYIQKLYDTDIDDPLSYDLVLNSDRYDHVQLVELILVAMQEAGYKLKHDMFDSLKNSAL